MPKTQLTERQKKVYDLIRSLISARGYGPTVREIGENFGIKSPNGVMCHLRALERKGLITRQANKSRAIEITDPHGRITTALPLVGIMSDRPMPIELKTTRMVDVGLCLPYQTHYAIQMSGDSLVDRGVLDGDYVIIGAGRDAQPGQLVLAETDAGHAVLRYWLPHSEVTELRSANKHVVPVLVREVTTLGVAIALVRKF